MIKFKLRELNNILEKKEVFKILDVFIWILRVLKMSLFFNFLPIMVLSSNPHG